MNLTAISIVALVCWAIVQLVNGPKSKRKDRKNVDQINLTTDLERDIAAIRDRIEILEKIVTDEKYDLNRQLDDLKRDNSA
jgi:hypothetical protein